MNTEETLSRLHAIENSEELTTKFRTKYATPFKMIKACINDNLIKKSAVNFIYKLTDGVDLNSVQELRVTEAMIDKAYLDYLSMEREDVARVLKEIYIDENIKSFYMLDACHDDLQVIERFEWTFTVDDFFNQIRD
jgi:hypothetical protein